MQVEAGALVRQTAERLVRGEPDPTWGEAVTAYVVPEDPTAGEQLTERIRHALEARLARYKLPKRLHLVGSLNLPLPGLTDSEKPASP